MMKVPRVLQVPSPEDSFRVHQVEKQMRDTVRHLDLCLASDSNSAHLDSKLAELTQLENKLGLKFVSIFDFYVNLARIHNESSQEALDKGFKAIRDIKKEFRRLIRLQKHGRRITEWADSKKDRYTLDSNGYYPQEFSDRFLKAMSTYFKITNKIHGSITDIVSIYWDYLPIEIQDVLESTAKSLILSQGTAASLTGVSGSVEGDYVEVAKKYEESKKSLYIAIFKALEQSKLRPKLRLSSLSGTNALKVVCSVVKEINQVPDVEQVRVVPVNPGDLHEITFYLQISQHLKRGPDNKVDELFGKAAELVQKANWKLRDSTGEDWYFFADIE